MCGRFTNRLTWREIVALYRLSIPATLERNLPARYNICPTDIIDAVIDREGKRELVPMRPGTLLQTAHANSSIHLQSGGGPYISVHTGNPIRSAASSLVSCARSSASLSCLGRRREWARLPDYGSHGVSGGVVRRGKHDRLQRGQSAYRWSSEHQSSKLRVAGSNPAGVANT